jgi:hypothetical protein
MHGFIYISFGVVLLIYDIFYRMLARPDILPNIGNAAAETAREPFCSDGIQSDYNALKDSRATGNLSLADTWPRDPSRKSLAEQLAGYALDFLVRHEFAHVIYGHSEYAAKEGIPFIQIRSFSNTAPIGLTLQAIEMNADTFAAVNGFADGLIFQDKESVIRRGTLERGSGIIHPDDPPIQDFAFAICILFWMIDEQVDPSKLEELYHPPAPQRPSLAISMIAKLLSSTDNKALLERLISVWPNAGNLAFNALREISGGRRRDHLIRYANIVSAGDTMEKHAEKVQRRWSDIRGEIAKFSHKDPPAVASQN